MNLDSIAAGIESAIKLSRLNGVFSEPSHEDLQSLFRGLDTHDVHGRLDGSLTQKRAALADALREKGRDREADTAQDPEEPLHVVHDDTGFCVLDSDHPLSAPSFLRMNPEMGWSGNSGYSAYVNAEPMAASYLNTAHWSSTFDGHEDRDDYRDGDEDRDGHPLDQHSSVNDFTPNAVATAHLHTAKFRESLSPAARQAVDDNTDQAGHDLWLTAASHGAGFWDGDWDHHERPIPDDSETSYANLGSIADELTDKAHQIGEHHVRHEWLPHEDGDDHEHPTMGALHIERS